LEARTYLSLPLFATALATAWRTDLIAGPIESYESSPEGVFFNMDEWFVPNG
jgi:hypothetical protein